MPLLTRLFKLKIISGMELPPTTLIQMSVDKIRVVGAEYYARKNLTFEHQRRKNIENIRESPGHLRHKFKCSFMAGVVSQLRRLKTHFDGQYSSAQIEQMR
jgi:hypothetical protein